MKNVQRIKNRYWGGTALLLDNAALLADLENLNKSEVGFLDGCADVAALHASQILEVFGRMAADYMRLPRLSRSVDDELIISTMAALNGELGTLLQELNSKRADFAERLCQLQQKGGVK